MSLEEHVVLEPLPSFPPLKWEAYDHYGDRRSHHGDSYRSERRWASMLSILKRMVA
jgi:hypothetical protein